MKKVCFMIACLLIVSNTPSFAAKIIVNDTNSRIVHSRSTSHYESDLDAAYHAQKGQPQVEEEQNFEEQHHEEMAHEENPEEFNEEHHEEMAHEEFQEENHEEFNEEHHEEIANEEHHEEPINYVKKDLTYEEINNLSADFRNELIGTYWNYAEADAQRAYEQQMAMEEEQRAYEEQMAMEEQARLEEEQRMLEEQRAMEEQMAMEEQAQEPQPEEFAEEPPMEEPMHEEIADINDEFNIYMMKKRGSREAADYYMIDSIKDPNVAIPSGFPQ